MIAACVCFLSILLTDVAAQRVEKNSSRAISKREAETVCDNGWYPFEDKCYRAGNNNEAIPWDRASRRCKEYGGTLATVHSQALSDFIRVFISMNLQGSAWIGLNDIRNESEYEWVDGTTLDFTNWRENEPHPNGREQEDCVELFLDSGKWNDLPCSHALKFICQKPGNKQGTRFRDPRLCDSSKGGWKRRTSCYVKVERRMTWQEAEDYCIEAYEGHLVTINNYSVNFFLEYILRNYIMSEDIWIGIKMKKGMQQWSSGWYVSFTDWLNETEVFMPDTCSARTVEKWAALPCNTRLPFICETSEAAPKMPFPEGMSCPDENAGWLDIGGNYCYHINSEHLTWTDANSKCLQIGGTLASFHSQIELDVLQPLIQMDQVKTLLYIWIGLRFQKENKEFAWIDGSPYDLSRWARGEPNSDKEDCAELNPRALQWYDNPCDENRTSICSVPKISTNKTTIIPTIKGPTTSCTDGSLTDILISVTACSLFVNVLLSIVVCYFCARGHRTVLGKKTSLHPHLDRRRETRQQSEYDLPIAPPPFSLKNLVSRHISDYEIAIEGDHYDYYESVR